MKIQHGRIPRTKKLKDGILRRGQSSSQRPAQAKELNLLRALEQWRLPVLNNGGWHVSICVVERKMCEMDWPETR